MKMMPPMKMRGMKISIQLIMNFTITIMMIMKAMIRVAMTIAMIMIKVK
jgi:hypothetical protein